MAPADVHEAEARAVELPFRGRFQTCDRVSRKEQEAARAWRSCPAVRLTILATCVRCGRDSEIEDRLREYYGGLRP
jgi:hypothetical protein